MSNIDDRYRAILKARQWVDSDPVLLDTETTGLRSDAEICEIAVVDLHGQTLIDKLVLPTRSIPADATNIHGITNDDVRDADTLPTLWPELAGLLRGRAVVIYNADYDTRLLRQSAIASGMESAWNAFREASEGDWRCLMKLFAEFYGERSGSYGDYRWQRLDVAARHFGIAIPPDQHRARADADLARQVLHAMASTMV